MGCPLECRSVSWSCAPVTSNRQDRRRREAVRRTAAARRACLRLCSVSQRRLSVSPAMAFRGQMPGALATQQDSRAAGRGFSSSALHAALELEEIEPSALLGGRDLHDVLLGTVQLPSSPSVRPARFIPPIRYDDPIARCVADKIEAAPFFYDRRHSCARHECLPIGTHAMAA